MDPQRQKKSRSLGVDPNPARQISATTTVNKRPEIGERNSSAPSVVRRRQSDAKRVSQGSKASDRTRRSSKASSRDDHPVPSTSTGDSQISDRTRTSTYSVKSSIKSIDHELLPLLTFAVVGNKGVGKSVFIRNALDLRRPPTPPISISKVSLNGVLYRLQLVETRLSDAVHLVSGKIPPSSDFNLDTNTYIDGVLCLYDVSDRGSLEGLPQLLTALAEVERVTCLVSCKTDTTLSNREATSVFRAKVKSALPAIVIEESNIESSSSAQRCILRVLKECIAVRMKEAHMTTRTRTDSNTPSIFPPRTSSRNPSAETSRSRSNSRQRPLHSKSRENLLTGPPPSVIESEDEEDNEDSSSEEDDQQLQSRPNAPLRVNTAADQPRNRGAQPQTPVSTTYAPGQIPTSPSPQGAMIPATPESLSGAAMPRRGSAETTDSHTYGTFLNTDDESIYEDTSANDEPTKQLQRLTTSEEGSSERELTTFDELVDRLLAMPTTSKADQKFMPAFLCLYRAFATPLRLLTAIIERFSKVEKNDMVSFTKAAELLRYLTVLASWTMYYPGDFADGKTREMATSFLAKVDKTKSYAAGARQVANNLQTCVPDDDEDWAFSDATKTSRSRSNTTSHKSSSTSTSSKCVTTRRWQAKGMKENDDSESEEHAFTRSSPRHSATTSSASSVVKGSQASSQTSNTLHDLETARENARRFRTIPHLPASKTQWHHFMGCSTEELALELTRIDWTMYSAIRPRDFVRYVIISNSQRERPGHIDHIGMMTKHFNHLALFVSGMILLRDKPKHRVKMLEKFMELAWKVRAKNNYHALGAIVAALTSEAIVRLTQTQELISQEQHKQFLRLKILMGHQKAHAAYRMAWDNSSGERIPFLPRVHEDLTKAANGNSTLVGGKINWSKFDLMGDSIVSVQRSQDQRYNLPDRTARGHEIDKLILETKVLEGDEECVDPQQELFERSKHAEPSIAGGERKKFDWLRR